MDEKIKTIGITFCDPTSFLRLLPRITLQYDYIFMIGISPFRNLPFHINFRLMMVAIIIQDFRDIERNL